MRGVLLQLWLGALVSMAALVATPSGAAPPLSLPEVGATVHGQYLLLGRVVPLPGGEWTVLGSGFGRIDGPSPGPYGALLGVVLAHRKGETVDALVLAATNMLPVAGGWGPSPECDAPGMAFTTGIKQLVRNLSCAFILPPGAGTTALASFPGWPAGAAEAGRRGWTLPGRMLVAGLRASDRRNAIEVRYAVADEPPGTAPAALAPWTQEAERRLAGALVGNPVPGALPWPAPGASLPPPPAGETARSRIALYRTLTNQAIQASISYALGMVLTGDPFASATLTFWQSATHAAVYYLNDMYWESPTILPAMGFVATAGRP